MSSLKPRRKLVNPQARRKLKPKTKISQEKRQSQIIKMDLTNEPFIDEELLLRELDVLVMPGRSEISTL